MAKTDIERRLTLLVAAEDGLFAVRDMANDAEDHALWACAWVVFLEVTSALIPAELALLMVEEES